MTPLRLILLGFALLIFGAVAPFSMMMRWIPSTLLLNMLSALASVIGMIVGLYGLFEMVRPNTRR